MPTNKNRKKFFLAIIKQAQSVERFLPMVNSIKYSINKDKVIPIINNLTKFESSFKENANNPKLIELLNQIIDQADQINLSQVSPLSGDKKINDLEIISSLCYLIKQHCFKKIKEVEEEIKVNSLSKPIPDPVNDLSFTPKLKFKERKKFFKQKQEKEMEGITINSFIEYFNNKLQIMISVYGAELFKDFVKTLNLINEKNKLINDLISKKEENEENYHLFWDSILSPGGAGEQAQSLFNEIIHGVPPSIRSKVKSKKLTPEERNLFFQEALEIKDTRNELYNQIIKECNSFVELIGFSRNKSYKAYEPSHYSLYGSSRGEKIYTLNTNIWDLQGKIKDKDWLEILNKSRQLYSLANKKLEQENIKK
jgi:hypothetical protein